MSIFKLGLVAAALLAILFTSATTASATSAPVWQDDNSCCRRL